MKAPNKAGESTRKRRLVWDATFPIGSRSSIGYALTRAMIESNTPYPLALATALVVGVLFVWLIHARVEAPAMALGNILARRSSKPRATGRGGVRLTPSQRSGYVGPQQGT
jgi:hypothetical protein